jgi:hypothetical protein
LNRLFFYEYARILLESVYGLPLQKEIASAASTIPENGMKFNPCNRDNSRLGRALALLTEGTDCRCCIGARIAAALVIGIVIGTATGTFL